LASNSQILGYTNFENRSIEIRNLATNELYSVSYDGYALDTVDWHPYEAKILAVTGNRILVWDVSSLISTLPTDTPTYPPGAPSIESHTLQKIETIIQVSSDGKLLAK